MGQQQLLLLVLGIVIVGLAVVVGIQAFNESKKKSEIDNYTATGVGMAGEVIAWYLKPSTTGGGGGSAASLAGLTIDKLGYSNDLQDTWGGFTRTATIANGTGRYLALDGTHPFFHITPYPIFAGMTRVEVHVFGPHQECVVTRHDRWQESATWSDGNTETTVPDNPDPSRCSW